MRELRGNQRVFVGGVHNLEAPPPPRKGDVLVRSDLPDLSNACLNIQNGGYLPYAEAYLRGTHRLVQHVIDAQRDQDFLVYPIVFLYRHHIELILKDILRRVPYLTSTKPSEAETRHLNSHSLHELWQDLKLRLPAMAESAGWGSLDLQDVEGIDSYISQLMRLDPDSCRFRYARSKKGGPSLPSKLKLINLRHFAEMMERLVSYLDAIDSAVDHLEEMEAECWRNSDCA